MLCLMTNILLVLVSILIVLVLCYLMTVKIVDKWKEKRRDDYKHFITVMLNDAVRWLGVEFPDVKKVCNRLIEDIEGKVAFDTSKLREELRKDKMERRKIKKL